MFNKENKLEKFKDAETIIGPSIKVKGNFQGKGDIVIEGMIEGSVKTAASLYVGNEAKVVANIEAGDASIHGQIHGNIKSDGYLAIGENAKIFGDIQYKDISIEKGAVINGQLVFNENTKTSNKKEKLENVEEERED
ncbi:MAG: polymer-forming cytoskeletal protein [Patescibacteria group bacterium]|jgi:cytoskeletal protein CcmA (bactofilin family)|nr:polymer-forming cytoskeletal protein [Patescibacteria group bacterium]